jgi:hypothetical protein
VVVQRGYHRVVCSEFVRYCRRGKQEIGQPMSQKSKLAGQGWARAGHAWALIVPRDVMGNPPNEMGMPGHDGHYWPCLPTAGHA